MLDLRGVAKPPLFDGRPLSYADWRFRFLAVADLIDLAELMKAAERHPVIIDQNTMSTTLKQKSRLLYGILVQ
eukprot:4584391-Heterocapsa_arctica.AAC.1